MLLRNSAREWRRRLTLCASAIALLGTASAAIGRDDPDAAADRLRTATPIKHVIVLIGENWSYNSLFATFEPRHGQTVHNLLSRGIINEDGTPGPNFAETRQFKVNTPLPAHYFISSNNKTAYAPFLPTPELNGAPNRQSSLADIQAGRGRPPFDNTVSQAMLAANEPSLEAEDLNLLRTGATGAAGTTGPDMRVKNFATLPNGVFQITNSATLPYDSYTGDTVHRLFHMWQQSDCDVANATPTNPSGCLNDLYPFVGTSRDDSGGNSMGFFNMDEGDVPVLNRLAHEFTLADNFHQSVMGGTAANHMMLGSGDAIFWTTFNGITQPPAKVVANPDPKSPTSDAFTVDGTFTECADRTQPGIAPIVDYLASLPWHPHSNCAAGNFYMINNVAPGFLPNGQIDTAHITAGTAVPPSPLRTIGDALNDKHISWAYFGGGFNAAVRAANGTSIDAFDKLVAQNYCNICNFASYTTSIMGDPAQRAQHMKDAIDFFDALQSDTLPSVSFVKPDSFLDGHPASSKPDLFEGMLEKIVDMLQSRPDLFADTVLFVTFDEGGGFHDTGFFQPLDFFGDAVRIPMIAVSPFARGGRVVHTYYDHVSVLKFIERNWHLSPLTNRSRDNLPNPIQHANNPYVPVNMPAIGDLFEMFNFDRDRDHEMDDDR
jgi:phospholipase C